MAIKSPKPGKSAISLKPARLLKSRGARAIAVAIIFVAAVVVFASARRQPSQPHTRAVEVPDQATPAPPSAAQPGTATVSVTHEAYRAAAPSLASVDAITISGCLERDDEKFRLKDTEGESAPRSRSWKVGFLKRRNRSVDVVDPRNRFKLENHLGERVSATGVLIDGDMQLRSLRRISTSCEKDV